MKRRLEAHDDKPSHARSRAGAQFAKCNVLLPLAGLTTRQLDLRSSLPVSPHKSFGQPAFELLLPSSYDDRERAAVRNQGSEKERGRERE